MPDIKCLIGVEKLNQHSLNKLNTFCTEVSYCKIQNIFRVIIILYRNATSYTKYQPYKTGCFSRCLKNLNSIL